MGLSLTTRSLPVSDTNRSPVAVSRLILPGWLRPAAAVLKVDATTPPPLILTTLLLRVSLTYRLPRASTTTAPSSLDSAACDVSTVE